MKIFISQVNDNEWTIENAYWHLLSTRGSVMISVTTWKPKIQNAEGESEAISETISYITKIVM